MKYIRAKDGRILVADDNSPMAKLTTNKIADTIEELTQEGDLVRYVDTTTPYPYQGIFTEIGIFNPVGTAIYRVIELYIKQPNGDYKLVARDKGNYKLELV